VKVSKPRAGKKLKSLTKGKGRNAFSSWRAPGATRNSLQIKILLATKDMPFRDTIMLPWLWPVSSVMAEQSTRLKLHAFLSQQRNMYKSETSV
jgi:hypothetical protein